MELANAGLHQFCGPVVGEREQLPVPQRDALVDDAQWLGQVSAQTPAFVARRLLAERVVLASPCASPVSETATEVVIDRAKVHDIFCGNLTRIQSGVTARSQRPIATIAFWREDRAPGLEGPAGLGRVGTQDEAAGSDITLSMAQCAGATITAIEGSHVIMISQPDAVTGVILAGDRATSPSVAVAA